MDRIIELFAKNRLLVNVIILVTLAVGIYSYLNIKNYISGCFSRRR